VNLVLVFASSAQEAAPYEGAITRRGGKVRVLTAKGGVGVTEALEGVSGLLLTGGADIHPKYYRQKIDPSAGVKTSPTRDAAELALLQEALARDMPVLGICRGMQLMNVAFGGSLLQDIPGHRLPDGERHSIFVSPGSKLGAIVGAGTHHRTNSYHHQGLKEPQKAPALLASSYMVGDGVVEGLESPAHSWVIGVQCHPEREDEVPRSFLNLFSNFLDWAGRYSGR
jgi:gamma-glutamyl-gamma-aminobutyrate hydrolase PuuD